MVWFYKYSPSEIGFGEWFKIMMKQSHLNLLIKMVMLKLKKSLDIFSSEMK